MEDISLNTTVRGSAIIAVRGGDQCLAAEARPEAIRRPRCTRSGFKAGFFLGEGHPLVRLDRALVLGGVEGLGKIGCRLTQFCSKLS